MIPVQPAPEPVDFEERVRRPGLDAIAELVGEQPSQTRRGPKRSKIATRRQDIPGAAYPPLWREVHTDMLTAYRRLCAYLALYIEPATGAPSVDHVIPKSKAWDKVYEWSKYRLACSLVNSRKGDTDHVLDPFEISEEWFALEMVEYQVTVGPGATNNVAVPVGHTIERLGLNDELCRQARREYVESYLEGEISFAYVKRRAPFIARELERQGLLIGDGA